MYRTGAGKALTAAAVSSWDPSSTTMISRTGRLWVSALRTARPTHVSAL
jgi:hypothetical protein